MATSSQQQIEQLKQTMAALEAQRALLGDAVVDNALGALKQQLAALEVQTPPTEVRRIVTVLFTDIVGSTSIAEKLDPEDWRQIVSAIHAMAGRVIQQHDGTVVQYLGDGLLAMFGAQTPSERDPENAIRAALEIQSSNLLYPTTNIHMRAGIHTGLVIVGEIGSEAKREFTGTGDAMNLTARLQSAAPPGGILISHDTYRLVRGMFDLTPQPLITVKGKSEPIQTYLVQRAQSRLFQTTARGVSGIHTHTIGRDAEIAQLQTVTSVALHEHKIAWAQLVGEPGMGKSRLLQTMMEQMRDRAFTLFRGRAFQGDEHQPFALIRRMWFDRFQIAEDAPLAETEAKWMEQFLALSGAGFEEAAHALGLLIGLPFNDSPYIGAMRHDPTQVKGRAIVVSRELFAKIRAETPIIVLLDDLQWADPSSWDYLMKIVSAPELYQNGVLVLGAARPEWNPPAMLLKSPNYVQIDLTSLPKEASRELAIELMQRVDNVTDDVIELIVERAEGVPYFAEEIVNWFLDRGIIDQTNDLWRFDPARLKESPLPATLQHLLLTRLSALHESERMALQRGSIFGRDFWEGGLKALGASVDTTALARLQPRNFIERQAESSFAGETEWSFHHNLLREVTYESVLKRDRKGLHHAAAQWLETQARQANRLDEFVATLGEHAERAGESSTAADWYLRAGDHARTRSAFVEALRFFNRALELLPVDDRQRRWYASLRRSDLLSRIGSAQAHRESVTQLLELANGMGDAQLALAHYRQGLYWDHQADYRAALPEYTIALGAAERASDHALGTTILSTQVICQGRLGEHKDAEVTAAAVLTRAYEVDEITSAKALSNLAVYYVEYGDLAKAAQFQHEQAAQSHRRGDRHYEATALNNLGYTYVCLGMFQAGREALEQSLKLYREIAVRREAAYASLNLGLAHWRLGDFRAALELLERMRVEMSEMDDAFGRAAGLSYLALVQEQTGDNANAKMLYRQACDIFSEISVRSYLADVHAGLARMALVEHNLDEARASAQAVWDFLQQNGAQGMEFPVRAYLTCADVFDALGESELSCMAVERGCQELNQRAEKISNLEWRKSFLTNVPEHLAITQKVKLLAHSTASHSN